MTYDKDMRFAARYLDVSLGTIKRLVGARAITHRRIGRRVKLAIEDLDEYQARHVVHAQAGPPTEPPAPVPALPLSRGRRF